MRRLGIKHLNRDIARLLGKLDRAEQIIDAEEALQALGLPTADPTSGSRQAFIQLFIDRQYIR